MTIDANERALRHAHAYTSIAENLGRCIEKLRENRLFWASDWLHFAEERRANHLWDAPQDARERARRLLAFFESVGADMQYGDTFEEAVAKAARTEWRQDPCAHGFWVESRVGREGFGVFDRCQKCGAANPAFAVPNGEQLEANREVPCALG